MALWESEYGNEKLGTRTGTLSESPFAEDGKDNVLLLGLNGNSTDRSRSRHTVTENGSPTYAAADSLGQVYGSSLVFNGTDAYLTAPDHSDWDIAGATDQDYTIDFWVKHTDHAGNEEYASQYEDANNYWAIGHLDGTGMYCVSVSGGATILYMEGGEITDTDFHHVAFCKVTSSGPTVEWAFYVDGTQVAYVSDTSTDTFAGVLYIGMLSTSTNPYDGHLNDLRIQKSNAFSAAPNVGKTDTITVPTVPHIADSNTALLLTFDEVTQGATPATITDSSLTPHTVTNVSSKASGCGYWWDGSIILNGTDQYLSIPDSDDWDVAGATDQDYTIDFWVKHDDHAGNEYCVSQYEDANNRWLLTHLHGTGLIFKVYDAGAAVVDLTSGELSDTNWHHVALTKVTSSGTTVEWSIYIDGAQTVYLSDTSVKTLTGALYIGAKGDASNYFDGQMDEVRITKSNIFNAAPNVGLTDTITVPTRPQL